MTIKIVVKILLLSTFITACSVSHYPVRKDWTSWNKLKDSPGIAFRTICKGHVYQGSKFFRWEVELKNEYPKQADLEIALSDNYNQTISESYQVNIYPGDIRKITFYNVKIPGGYPHKLMISSLSL